MKLSPPCAQAAALLVLGAAAAASAAPLRVGSPAPALAAPDLDGRRIDLAALKDRVVVVNLWATWCAPCRAEMPMLDAVYRQHRAQGLALIAFSADRTRDKGEVRKVMSAFSYPSAMLAEARPNALGQPKALPETFVVDRTGVVRAVFDGEDGPLTEQKLEAAVKPLL